MPISRAQIPQQITGNLRGGRKETPRTGYGIGLSPVTQLRRHLHRKRIKKERARDKAKTKKMKQGGIAFGGEKRIPGSGAATKGTGFKGIF